MSSEHVLGQAVSSVAISKDASSALASPMLFLYFLRYKCVNVTGLLLHCTFTLLMQQNCEILSP